MKQNIEIEFKSLLSPYDFNRLKNGFFKNAILTVQQNEYYDTLNRDLFDHKIVLRIRRFNDSSLFTLKMLDENNQILEHEFEGENLQIDHPSIKNLLNDLNLPTQCICVSQSRTHRHMIVDEFGEWCLDLNEFKNHVDFELEYELTQISDQGLNRFLDFLEANDIIYHKAFSKYVRSFE